MPNPLTRSSRGGEVGEEVPDARWLLDQHEAFIAAMAEQIDWQNITD